MSPLYVRTLPLDANRLGLLYTNIHTPTHTHTKVSGGFSSCEANTQRLFIITIDYTTVRAKRTPSANTILQWILTLYYTYCVRVYVCLHGINIVNACVCMHVPVNFVRINFVSTSRLCACVQQLKECKSKHAAKHQSTHLGIVRRPVEKTAAPNPHC
jgi:hypothetical protein